MYLYRDDDKFATILNIIKKKKGLKNDFIILGLILIKYN